MTEILTIGVCAVAWWLIRSALGAREERRFDARYERRDGVVVGAESIRLSGPRAGAVLLLHGYNDSPQSVASMATALHSRGWTVWAPLLPGHGRSLQAFAKSGADDWVSAARSELATLQALHPDVAVGGLSMGGALAFVLAAENTRVRAVVAFAPYVHVSLPLRALEVAAPIATLGARYVWSGGTRSVHDSAAAAQMIAYRRSTPRLLAQLDRVARLAFGALGRVRQPVLLVQSREDNRIPARTADRAFERIGSADKTLHWVTGTGHVLTVDYGHAGLERFTADWLETRLS